MNSRAALALALLCAALPARATPPEVAAEQAKRSLHFGHAETVAPSASVAELEQSCPIPKTMPGASPTFFRLSFHLHSLTPAGDAARLRRTAFETAAPPLSSPAPLSVPAHAQAGWQPSAEQKASDWYQAGTDAFVRGDRVTAETAYRQALAAQPAHLQSRISLCALLFDAGRSTELAETLAPGLAIAPDEPQLKMLQARLWSAQGQPSLALALLMRNPPALDRYPAYYALAAALQQRLGRHDAASGLYRALVQRAGADPAWWIGLAISEEAQGRDAQARDAYVHARASGRLPQRLDDYARERLTALGS
jgi:MSHA biogenesis protein MshN